MPGQRAHLPYHRRFRETTVQFGFVAIGGAAAEFDVVDRRFATRGIGHDVCIPSGFRTPQERPGCEATAPALHSHSGLRALSLYGLGTRQRHPRMTPRGLVDRGRQRVKSLVLAMKTFSSTQLGPDRVARNALIPRCGTTGGPSWTRTTDLALIRSRGTVSTNSNE